MENYSISSRQKVRVRGMSGTTKLVGLIPYRIVEVENA
jgi:hypothetical protein